MSESALSKAISVPGARGRTEDEDEDEENTLGVLGELQQSRSVGGEVFHVKSPKPWGGMARRKQKRVYVEFGEETQAFRLVSNLTFRQLLREATRFFGVDIDEMELCDEEGVVWPLSSDVRTELKDSASDGFVLERSGEVGETGAGTEQRGYTVFLRGRGGGNGRWGGGGVGEAGGSSSGRGESGVREEFVIVEEGPPQEIAEGGGGNSGGGGGGGGGGAWSPPSVQRVVRSGSSSSAASSSSTPTKAPFKLIRSDPELEWSETVLDAMIRTHYTNSKMHLVWESPPTTVLLVRKLEERIAGLMDEVADWLQEEMGMTVLIEPGIAEQHPQLRAFDAEELASMHERVDLIVTMGGDGTVLHASSLFTKYMPPVIAFNLGTLGFMTSFEFVNYRRDLTRVLEDQFYISLRSRLSCHVENADGEVVAGSRVLALNEIVIDRGTNPIMSSFDFMCDNHFITNFQADGMIVSSATGSTAYSLSAGGAILHPSVPGILLTPICAHSLAFRPIVLPDDIELRIRLSKDSRADDATVSFDGRGRMSLRRTDSVVVRMSTMPVPCIAPNNETADWFSKLAECLSWGERSRGVGGMVEKEDSLE